jgi:hypothetical protein
MVGNGSKVIPIPVHTSVLTVYPSRNIIMVLPNKHSVMDKSKGGPRADLLDTDEVEMYRPRFIKTRAQKRVELFYKLITVMWIVAIALLILDVTGTLNSWLGV